MKRNYWPLFFIGIFSFTMYMIFWTIYSASKVPVNKDESFLSTYADVDDNFNKIVNSNKIFSKYYDVEFVFNNKKTGLTYKDIFLSQRVIDKQVEQNNYKHADMLILGKNDISVILKDKQGNIIKDAEVKLRVTRPTNHNDNIELDTFSFENSKFNKSFDLQLRGLWNVTGYVKVADKTGYIYIKTNAKK